MLIGSYFTQEYALESAALSILRWSGTPTSRGCPRDRGGSCSACAPPARATSRRSRSAAARSTRENRIRMDEPTRFVTAPEQVPNTLYDKTLFFRKLDELGVEGPFTGKVLGTLNDQFTLDELQAADREHPAPEPAAAPRERAGRPGDADAGQDRTTRSAFRPSRRSPSGSSFRRRRPRPTASRTPGSSSSTTTTGRSAITRRTPPLTAR